MVLTTFVLGAALGAVTASADPMPAGDYTAQLTGGVLEIGNVQLPISSGSTGALTIPGTGPINWSAGAVVLPTVNTTVPISGYGTADVAISPAVIGPVSILLDPGGGSASASVAGYVNVVVVFAVPLVGSTTVTCRAGTAQAPIVLNPSTAGGSTWNSATGTISLVDGTWVGAVDCDPGTFGDLVEIAVSTLTGPTTTPGSNELRLNGTLTRNPDSGSTTDPGGTQQPGTDGQVVGDQPQTTSKRCLVPRLRGLRLRGARRALRRANCRLGTVRRRASRRTPGTVIAQGRRAGRRLPAGSPVSVVLARRP